MDAGLLTSSVVAVVGVVGTLLSALLTQRAADRSRQREQERAEARWERRSEVRERRACYVALNASVRHYLAALTDQVHALGREGELPLVRQRLTEARDQHREVYAEAQMRLPEGLLDLAGGVSHDLGTVYGMVRRLDDGVPRPGDTPAAVEAGIDALWERLRETRREMRRQIRADQGGARADHGH